MYSEIKQSARHGERGNVLFLILIAVALFAALSYAVTQSTQGDGGGADENALINSAQVIQYPSSLKTAVVRMIIRGTDYASLEFNPPADYGDLTSTSFGVFHPDGGGATYVTPPASLMASGSTGTWYFNAHFEIADIQTSSASDAAGNDIVAFLPGITSTLCARINKELGVSGDTIAAADISANYEQIMDDAYTIPSSETILGTSTGTNTLGLRGKPFGCFRNGAAGEYVYYHVLLEK